MTDPLHAVTLGDVVRDHARHWPHKTAAVCGGARLTYPQLDERTSRLANLLRGHGVGAGETVLWLGQNCHRVLEGLLACAKLGAAFCPANWRQSPAELTHVVDVLAPTVVLWQQAEIGAAVQEARGAADHEAVWIAHDDAGPDGYEAVLTAANADDPDVPVDPAATVLVLFTAAFTGRPHAAGLRHDGLIHQGLVTALVHQLAPDHTELNSGPLFHVATFARTVATLLIGGANVFTARADAEEMLRLISEERCNAAFLQAPTVQRMGELNADGHWDLSSLVSPRFGVEGFDEHVTRPSSPWLRRAGGYGQTEVTGMVTLASGAGTATAGRSIPGTLVRVVDPDGREVGVGETGEIVVRGPVVMNGYRDDAEETDRRQRGGWHHTGDLGRREPDGTIAFVAPMTRLIKTGAENVYPAEVEQVLTAHPGVFQAVVIGVPDPTWAQNVKALVRRDKDHDPPVTADELIEHCREHLASYKKPKIVEFVDGFPKTPTGVIDRDACDEQYGGGGYPGAG